MSRLPLASEMRSLNGLDAFSVQLPSVEDVPYADRVIKAGKRVENGRRFFILFATGVLVAKEEKEEEEAIDAEGSARRCMRRRFLCLFHTGENNNIIVALIVKDNERRFC